MRIAWAAASGLLHVWLSWKFNFEWVHGANGTPGGIDGGPLGFLTWATPAIAGTVACDIMRSGAGNRSIISRLVGWGLVVAAVAYGFSSLTTLYNVAPVKNADSSFPAWYGPAEAKRAIDPVIPTPERLQVAKLSLPELPFVPPPTVDARQLNYWMMSQRAGSWTYTMYAGGLAMIIMAFFYWFSDILGVNLGVFRTLGSNALIAYMLQSLGGMILRPIFGPETPAGWAIFSLFVHIVIIYSICRFLEWMKWYVRM